MPLTDFTLTEFLTARFDEDEAKIDGDWSDGYDLHIISEAMRNRMLAEIAAKRRIVSLFEEERGRRDIYNRDYDSGEYDFNENDLRARLASNAHCRGLEEATLAHVQPYADHPDFREEWRA